jgi:four helix bundle protein
LNFDFRFLIGYCFALVVMDEDLMKRRTKKFGLPVIKLVESLPKNITGRAIGGQLVGAGTSVGANYRAACRSRSKAEFIARLGVVEEEADESSFWMEMIVESGLVAAKLVESLLAEANEIVAMMTSSRISAARTKTSLGGNGGSQRTHQSQIKKLKSRI